MADEQPSASAEEKADSGDGDAAGDGRAPKDAGDIDDVKRKFREALDRKRDQHAHANADAAQATGKVHGAHGPASSRRSFRRKSGG
jgi:Family of unknown function (DUF5302)